MGCQKDQAQKARKGGGQLSLAPLCQTQALPMAVLGHGCWLSMSWVLPENNHPGKAMDCPITESASRGAIWDLFLLCYPAIMSRKEKEQTIWWNFKKKGFGAVILLVWDTIFTMSSAWSFKIPLFGPHSSVWRTFPATWNRNFLAAFCAAESLCSSGSPLSKPCILGLGR